MEAMLLLVHYCLNDLVNCQVDIVKLCGIVNWSMDLISSLPHQTAKMWDETLQLTVQLMQNSSMYMYMICKLRKILNLTYCIHRVTFRCHLNQSAEFYKMASETLAKAGYEHYEISSYSKSGYQCQHNVILEQQIILCLWSWRCQLPKWSRIFKTEETRRIQDLCGEFGGWFTKSFIKMNA